MSSMSPTALFTVATTRFDPYKNFRFRVVVDGKYVAGVSKVSVLKRTTEVVKFRAGADPTSTRLSPGQTSFDPITLEQGITYDPTFEQWANKVWSYNLAMANASTNDVSLADFRKNISIELHNETGQIVFRYLIYRAWVSEYQALPELDGMGSAIAISTIKLENEGWVRDVSLTESAAMEPTIADAAAASGKS